MKKNFKYFFILFFITLSISKTSKGQTWFREGFDVVQVPADTTPIGWSQRFASGSVNGFPNGFKRYTSSSYPTIGPGGFSGIGGFIKFNNRGANYPAVSGSWCVAGDAAILTTPSLDWTGRTNTAQGWISFRFYRSSSVTGGVHLVADSISVFLNTKPDLAGAIELTESSLNSKFVPRSSLMAPAGTNNTWNLLQYNLPAYGTYPQLDTSAAVYMIIKATSRGGDNMYVDSVNVPTYPTPMVLQGAQVFFQPTSVNKSTTDNAILGIRIYAHGTLTPKTIDSLSFSPVGSTNPLTDISTVKLFYTQTSPVFSIAGTQYSGNRTTASMNFSYYSSPCPFPSVTGAPTFKTGWNYFWLTYNIPATAVSSNLVDAQFIGFNSGGQPCSGFQTVNLSVPGGVTINAVNYLIPTYTSGTSSLTDFISGVESYNGQNATAIDNWYHDVTVGPPCVNYCDRFDSHPDDYTLFGISNLGVHKNRFVQEYPGQGVREGTAPLILHAAPGTTLTTNCIAVFVDWNADGDFYDTYNGGGPGGPISENYGTQCLGAGTPSNPFGIGNSFGTWLIDVPSKNDAVTNGSGIGAALGGPLHIGNTRLRIREAYAVSNIESMQSGYTWGETEDYTIAVIESCPLGSINVCRWLGVTSDWNDPINWCPDVPTINDMAYIPSLQPAYPVLGSGVKAFCRTLKIIDGANLTVNCQSNGSLTVADSLIIGANSIASSSWLKVNSNFNDSVTIPTATTIPPNGFGSNLYTPFKQNQNSKFQIAYTAAELTSVYGLSNGDVIDHLTFLLKTTPASTATYPAIGGGFRIRAYYVSSPVIFPATLSSGVSVAVKSGNPNVINSVTIYTGTFNITPGQSSLTLNLIPNSLVFDVSSNLVLSFEYFGGTAIAGVSQLYCELGSQYQSLFLTCNTSAISGNQNQSGYSIDGLNSSNGAFYSGVTGGTTNYRPRIDFGFHKVYNSFPIIIGKAFVNNNNSGSPVGANGFISGNSRVTFDPSVRSTVNSPGLASITNTYNPTLQSATLSPDTMCITSGINPLANGSYTSGVSSTVFNALEVKANTTGAAGILNQNKNAYSDSLILTSGEFRLNQNLFTLKKGKPAALKQTNGWIRSESPGGGNSSAFKWNIGSNHNTFTIPFGISSTSIFKFVYTGISGSIGNLTVSTYGTASNNLPLPTGVTNINDTNGLNNSLYTVDRFWKTSVTSTTATGNFQFSYRNSEAHTPINNGNVRAQRWNISSAKWIINSLTQTNTIGPGISKVTVSGISGASLNSNWAFADQSHPLRLMKDEYNITAYPLPFENSFTLNVNSNENYILRVFDFTGRQIEEKTSTEPTIELGNQWTDGIYLITVQQQNEIKKITVVKN